MSSTYQKALDEGYSEEEIKEHLSKKDPKFQQALNTGYSPEEIQEFLDKKSKPQEKKGIELAPGQKQLGQALMRGIETIGGMPRATGDFLESLVPDKALLEGAEKLGLKGAAKKGRELTKKYAPHQLLPTSKDIREFGKTLFGNTFEPSSDLERVAGDVVEDFTALAFPIFGGQFKVVKPFLASLGGNLAKETALHFGKSEETGSKIKLGTMALTSLINPKGADKLKNELYRKADLAKPTNAKVTASNTIRSTANLKNQLSKGSVSATSKSKSLKLIDEIEGKIQNNEILVDDLEQFKRDINEARSGLYEEFAKDKVGRKSAKRNLDSVSKIIDDALTEYGNTNPQWAEFYRPANEIHGTIAQSKKWGNIISKHAKKFATPGLAGLFGIGHAFGAGPAALAAGAGFAGLKGGELIARVMKSPHLRRLYMDTIKDAIKRNVKSMNENLSKLDFLLQK